MGQFKFSKIDENGDVRFLKGKGERGDKMSAHHSDRDAFLLVVKGEVNFRLGSEVLPLAADDFLEIPAKVVHSFEVSSPSELLLIVDREAKMTFLDSSPKSDVNNQPI